MSKGRKCNKAYWEMEAGLTDQPCFFVYNGVCWKPKDLKIPCPIPKMPNKKVKEGGEMKQITEDYCSLEIAKLLNEKGFDEPLNTWIDKQCVHFCDVKLRQLSL